jgi:mono/diheme cytochrome c family protein
MPALAVRLVPPAALWLLGFGLAQGQPPKNAPRVEPTPALRASARPEAAALYQRLCQRCHGEDGTGGRGRDRMAEIPDFTQAAWQARRSDAQLRVSILDGKASDMPAFHERLSDSQARDLVAYLRAFGPGRPAPARAAPDDFERQLHQLQEELAELRRQFRELADAPPGPRASQPAAHRETHR